MGYIHCITNRPSLLLNENLTCFHLLLEILNMVLRRHLTYYTYRNQTAVGNNCHILHALQNMNGVGNRKKTYKFSMQSENFPLYASNEYILSKFSLMDTLFISRIFCCDALHDLLGI